MPLDETISLGQTGHIDDHEAIAVAVNALGSGTAVAVKGTRSSDLSINSATATIIDWDAEELDTHGFHDNGTNPSRFTVPSGQDGTYLFGANLSWTLPLADQSRTFITLLKNGSIIKGGRFEGTQSGSTAEPSPAGSVLVSLVATDYVQVQVYHNHGSARSVESDNCAAWLVKQ